MGCKRFVSMHESPYHGLNFCQGTVERDAGRSRQREIFDVIRWFGTRGKLFNVHFRNIRGCKLILWRCFPTREAWTWRDRCGVPGGRVSVHADARSRAGDRWPRPIGHGICVLLWVYTRAAGLRRRLMAIVCRVMAGTSAWP